MEWGGVGWTHVAQDRRQWRDLVKTVVKNLRVPQNARNLATSETISLQQGLFAVELTVPNLAQLTMSLWINSESEQVSIHDARHLAKTSRRRRRSVYFVRSAYTSLRTVGVAGRSRNSVLMYNNNNFSRFRHKTTLQTDYETNQLTTYLIPYSRVLLEKLKVPRLFKQVPAPYENRRFITAFTNPFTCPHTEPD